MASLESCLDASREVRLPERSRLARALTPPDTCPADDASRELMPHNPHTHPPTLTHTPSPTHLHNLTHAPSHTYPYPHALTHTASPTHPHPHSLTHTPSSTHPHLHSLTPTPSPTLPHPQSLTPHPELLASLEWCLIKSTPLIRARSPRVLLTDVDFLQNMIVRPGTMNLERSTLGGVREW